MRARSPFTIAALAGAAALLVGGTVAVAVPATAAAPAPVPVADQAVSRFVAWQACSAATWRWVAQNAKIGTSVDTHLNHYRPSLEWRERGGWFVQIAGTAHEPVTANNDSSYCLVKGTNAAPTITDYAFPR